MKLSNVFSLAVTVILMSGCASTFTKTGNYESKPRELGCDFTLYTTPPGNFKEVGLISFYTGTGNSVYTLDGVKKTAQEFVCQAGGNGLIVPEPTKDGIYRQGTVVWVPN